MTRFATPWLVVLTMVLPLAIGCSDDDDTPATGSDSTVQADASVGTDSGGTADSGTELAAISGIAYEVSLGDTQPPAADVTVTALDQPSISTTTSASGAFSLQVPAGIGFVHAAKTDLMSTIVGGELPTTGLTGLEIDLIPETLADTLFAAVSLPTRDAAKGVVAVVFDVDALTDSKPAGTEAATISATNDGSLIFDSNDDPAQGSHLIAGGGDVLIFANVTTGTTTVTLDAPGCSLELPASQAYPVRANTVTFVYATCSP